MHMMNERIPLFYKIKIQWILISKNTNLQTEKGKKEADSLT